MDHSGPTVIKMLMIPNHSRNDPTRIVIFRHARGKLFDRGPMSLARFGFGLAWCHMSICGKPQDTVENLGGSFIKIDIRYIIFGSRISPYSCFSVLSLFRTYTYT